MHTLTCRLFCGLTCVGQVIEGQDSINVDDRELSRVTVHLQLLRPAPQLQFVFKLDVGQGELQNLATASTNNKRVWSCSNCRDRILSGY